MKINIKTQANNLLIYLLILFQVFFQEVEGLDKYYTIFSGVTILDLYIILYIIVSPVISLYNKRTRINKQFLIFNIVFFIIGLFFGYYSLGDKLKDSHYFIYTTFGFYSISNIDDENIVKLGRVLVKSVVAYIIIFACIYLTKKELVTEYGFRVVSRFDVVLPLLYILIPKLFRKKIISLIIQFLILIKILLSVSRGLIGIFLIVLIFDFVFFRIKTIYSILPILFLALIAVKSPQFNEFRDFFGSRFGELFSDDEFSLDNTASYNAKQDDLNSMNKYINVLPNGFGSSVSTSNSTKAESGYYTDNLFLTVFFKFGIPLGLIYLLGYTYFMYKITSVKVVFYFILLWYNNVSLIYWRSSLMIFLTLLIIGKIEKNRTKNKSITLS